jgi:hypothetical protein
MILARYEGLVMTWLEAPLEAEYGIVEHSLKTSCQGLYIARTPV